MLYELIRQYRINIKKKHLIEQYATTHIVTYNSTRHVFNFVLNEFIITCIVVRKNNKIKKQNMYI